MRLIDADEPREKLEELSRDSWNENCAPQSWSQAFIVMSEMLEECRTVDAVPVVHGHWIEHDNEWGMIEKCSNCGIAGMLHWNYCYNCGAKMDKKLD